MAWDNRKILVYIAVGMLGSMANVSYGGMEYVPEVSTIDEMKYSAAYRRVETWINAVDKGDETTLRRIIPNAPPGCTPLIHWAIMRAGIRGKSKWSNTFHKLIAAGADPNERDALNLSTLHEAAIRGCFEIMKWLLDFGIDPNGQDSNGQTPLHYAALFGHLGCVRLLLEYAADPNIQSQEEETALDYAIEGRKTNFERKKLSAKSKKNYDKIIRLLRRLSAA
jgi:ankyrin repeat protein